MTGFAALREGRPNGRSRNCPGCGTLIPPGATRGTLQVALRAMTPKAGEPTSYTRSKGVASIARRFCEDCSVELFTQLDEVVRGFRREP
jgi:hypothetical protein